jgi:NitT/TauT family transport system substrate-binding protein
MLVNRMTRRDMFAGALAAMAMGAPAIAQNLPTVSVASSPNDDLGAILYAMQAGLFRKAGINVTLQAANNGSAVAAGVVGGAFDIGKISAIPIINAHFRNVPLSIVFPNKLRVAGRPTDDALVVAANSPIRSARELNGKRVAVAALKDTTWITACAWIDANGGDSSTVQFIEMPLTAVASALEADRVQAGCALEPYTQAGVRSGKTRIFGDLDSAIAPHFLQSAWCATPMWAGANRQSVLAFGSAISEAARYCNAHAEKVSLLVADFTKLDAATMAEMRTTFAVRSDPNELAPWIDVCVRYKLISQKFDVRELYLERS